MGFGNFGPGCCCSICSHVTSNISDDFSGGSFDTTKFWHAGSATVSGGVATLSGGNDTVYIHEVDYSGITGPDDANVWVSDTPSGVFLEGTITAASGTSFVAQIAFTTRESIFNSALSMSYSRSGSTYQRAAGGQGTGMAGLWLESGSSPYSTPMTFRLEMDFVTTISGFQAGVNYRAYLDGVQKISRTYASHFDIWHHKTLGDVCELWATFSFNNSGGTVSWDDISYGPL